MILGYEKARLRVRGQAVVYMEIKNRLVYYTFRIVQAGLISKVLVLLVSFKRSILKV